MDTYHVVPVDDLIGHEEQDDACVCGPHVGFYAQGRVVVHQALDGRHAEDPEWARRRADQVAGDHALAE